ncbi:transmembrane protein 47-like [Sceloporus undulatus]|uniref:transmembrane protein 47-like n=1 Tax=Sceloporus undulatus TaxID=8520 RepID=UPI001C4B2FD3|nr:transmembrane protein 47-like [Sceloporus undulatus]
MPSQGEEEDEEEEGSLLRPLKLIALLCASLALALDAAALGSPAWVTSQEDSLALWQTCRRHQDGGAWQCHSALQTDWQIATLVLILTAATITLLSFFMSLISFCLGTYKRYYRVIAVLLFAAVVLQVCALILYPIKFIDSNQLRSYHEFSWGYGLGWGSVIFMLGAAILYCLRIDVYEEAYH